MDCVLPAEATASVRQGLAQHRLHIRGHLEPVAIPAVQAQVQAHQDPVRNLEEVERGRDPSTQAPTLAGPAAAEVATTVMLAGATRMVPGTLDRARLVNSPARRPRDPAVEAGADGRRAAMEAQ